MPRNSFIAFMTLRRVLVVAVVLSLFLPAASSEENVEFTVTTADPLMETGDYFLYEFDMSAMFESMESDDAVVEVIEEYNSGMRMEYGGDSCLQTGWTDCYIGLMSWNMELKIIYNESIGVDNDTAIMKMSFESTIVDSGSKSQETTIGITDIKFSIGGDEYHSEGVETEVSIEITTVNNEPERVSLGDTWTIEKRVENTINSKSRDNGEPWEHDEEVIENYTVVNTRNALSVQEITTELGTFNTMKIEDLENDSTSREFAYVVASGMPIKLESYNDMNENEMSATLIEYDWSGENAGDADSEEDELLPGFSFITTIVSVTMALFILRKNNLA